MNILVVDDDLGHHKNFKRLLEIAILGSCVWIVPNKDEALVILRRSEVDIMLIDFWLSGKENGLVVTKGIKREYPDIPVILLSAEDIRELDSEAVLFRAFYKLEDNFFKKLTKAILSLECKKRVIRGQL